MDVYDWNVTMNLGFLKELQNWKHYMYIYTLLYIPID